ncbi:uncharacterized protein VTP21DRAFT_6653 [Calcarisporiella thermophila]|uniref:uncharacterized protein n=1 Tax=Calcarisporiella thermophila TaxID=911321 RepID=UPI003742C9BF
MVFQHQHIYKLPARIYFDNNKTPPRDSNALLSSSTHFNEQRHSQISQRNPSASPLKSLSTTSPRARSGSRSSYGSWTPLPDRQSSQNWSTSSHSTTAYRENAYSGRSDSSTYPSMNDTKGFVALSAQDNHRRLSTSNSAYPYTTDNYSIEHSHSARQLQLDRSGPGFLSTCGAQNGLTAGEGQELLLEQPFCSENNSNNGGYGQDGQIHKFNNVQYRQYHSTQAQSQSAVYRPSHPLVYASQYVQPGHTPSMTSTFYSSSSSEFYSGASHSAYNGSVDALLVAQGLSNKYQPHSTLSVYGTRQSASQIDNHSSRNGVYDVQSSVLDRHNHTISSLLDQAAPTVGTNQQNDAVLFDTNLPPQLHFLSSLMHLHGYQQQTQQQAQQQLPPMMVPPPSPNMLSYYYQSNHQDRYNQKQYPQPFVGDYTHGASVLQEQYLPAIQQYQGSFLLGHQHLAQQQQSHQQQQKQQQPQPPYIHQQKSRQNLASQSILGYHNQPPINHVNGVVNFGNGSSGQRASTQNLLYDYSAALDLVASAYPSGVSNAIVPAHLIDPRKEEWRDNILHYTHRIYSQNPLDPSLMPMLQELHSYHPQHLPTLLLLACVYYCHQDYQKSLYYNQLILSIDPNYVEAMSNIGTTLRRMGRSAEAEEWWWRAVRLRPTYWDAFENLIGVLCLASQEDDGANKGDKRTEKKSTRPRYKEALELCNFVEQHALASFSRSTVGTQSLGGCATSWPAQNITRFLNLFHTKGNIRCALSDMAGARAEYEKGLEFAFGGRSLLEVVALTAWMNNKPSFASHRNTKDLDTDNIPLVLLSPEQALHVISSIFTESGGVLPGLAPLNRAVSVGSSESSLLQQGNQMAANMLLTLAKLFQDAMAGTGANIGLSQPPTMAMLLPLYYLSLSLHPSPSTCNNLGILLATITAPIPSGQASQQPITGSSLAMKYYTYGLQLDPKHPHLYTNLGSLLKDMGHLAEAVQMYEKAVECNPRFDVALANLGNAVKDMGRVQDSVQWYMRAVEVNPNFSEAICGLVNALGSVCDWRGRGGVGAESVDTHGRLLLSSDPNARSGWLGKMYEIVERQLDEGIMWGHGVLSLSSQGSKLGEILLATVLNVLGPEATSHGDAASLERVWRKRIATWTSKMHSKRNEGGWIIRLIERLMRRVQRRWYLDMYGANYGMHYVQQQTLPVQHPPLITPEVAQKYARPMLPSALASPAVPTVLPFHTFTYPLSARQVRLISHRNALRISHSTLTSSWLPSTVYPPPPPPNPRMRIGYVSSDFNNHPLAHLMQSVFGFHDRNRFEVFCYATSPSDNSPYRQKIEREAEHFFDVSSWGIQQIVERIIKDGIHILVNLNGYTKGARNEVFAARPAPILCSFMGFAGTLGGGWCDWIVADAIVCPPQMVSCERWRERRWMAEQRRRRTLAETKVDSAMESAVGSDYETEFDFEGDIDPEEETDEWVYNEKFIYMPDSYFVNDHRQGFREEDYSSESQLSQQQPQDSETRWAIEQDKRWKMRRELFPGLRDDTFIFANFNQLYKIDPAIFRVWLRILARVPNSILWLLRFPAAGEAHLLRTAKDWAGEEVASRVIFTDVAPKHIHIHRGRIADLFLDTPECNAHTTACDILWSGTPIVTYPRYEHKMCSRVAASIAKATGFEREMVVNSEQEYEERAVALAQSVTYDYVMSPTSAPTNGTHPLSISAVTTQQNQSNGAVHYHRYGRGALMDLRRHLFLSRDSSKLFDTKRWTRNLEQGYMEAWRRWVSGEEFEDLAPSKRHQQTGCIWISTEEDKGDDRKNDVQDRDGSMKASKLAVN